jgi:predicted PurR-regulated permease PerM
MSAPQIVSLLVMALLFALLLTPLVNVLDARLRRAYGEQGDSHEPRE